MPLGLNPLEVATPVSNQTELMEGERPNEEQILVSQSVVRWVGCWLLKLRFLFIFF